MVNAGQNGRTCPKKPSSQVRTRTGKTHVQLARTRTDILTRLVHSSLEKVFHFLNVFRLYVCMVITYSRVWINRVRLPILLVVS